MMLGFGRNKDSAVSASYLSHFELSAPPFADDDGKFLFLDAERQQSLDMLQHLTQYSEEVLLVCGELGAGKSTLCQQFIQRSETHWRSCYIDGADGVEADTLFAHLARCFELNLHALPPEQLLSGLQSQLSALQEQRLAVLLVDNAQKLSSDALEIIFHLAQLEGEHGKLIRLLLFSEPDIVTHLAEPRFAALPPAHRIDIKGLTEADTANYILHRLRVAGMTADMPLDNKDIRQIHRSSHGLPGQVNLLAHKLLQQKSQRGDSRTNRQMLKLAIAGTAIIGTVLGLQGRVHELISSDKQALSIGGPERPVVRLSDEAQPWGVVIRDGESIQISCGATAADTVGVRPTFSSAALFEPSERLARPLLMAQATAGGEAEIETPAETPPLTESPTTESEPEKVDVVEPVQQTELPPAETESFPVEPVEVSLQEVIPSPVVARQELQHITIRGQGFVPGSKLALSRAGQVEVMADELVNILNGTTITIQVNTGLSSSAWAVQLSTPDGRRSNVLRFQVMSEARLPVVEPAQTSESVEASEVQDAQGDQVAVAPIEVEEPKALVAPAADAQLSVPVIETEKATAQVPPPLPAKSLAKDTAAIHGTDWLAAQRGENYTVQLLVSSEKENLQSLVKQHQPPPPLAQFAMAKDGRQLYVLTQGSYNNRDDADRAAAKLPADIRPWIRTLASVQELMQPIAAQAPAPAMAVSDLSGVKDDAWVWSQNPAHYTIQLAAASSEKSILEAMQGLNLPGERVVVQTLRNGRPWYALIYGSFSTSEVARSTVARMPESLRQAGPWPRSFASVQDEMSRSTATP